MIPVYNEHEFDAQTLACANCGWSGKGQDALVIDFYGITESKEVHCPECDEKIALLRKEGGGPPGETANDLSFQLG